MTLKLPLFPLNLVLFPGTPLPLHIFEERYRLMIGQCIEQQSPFGVVLINEGAAEESNVTFMSIGTTAQITDAVRLEDGRYYLVAVGQRRFRIEYLTQRLPFYVASVTPLDEQGGGPLLDLANDLRGLYQRYWEAVSAATGSEPEPEALPTDSVDLTYWMANRLQVSLEQKQRWLETDVATRLREINGALRRELSILPNTGGKTPPPTGYGSLN
jgi:Lon protease-like protein